MNKLSVFVMVIIVSALITPFIFASTNIITSADSEQNKYYVSNYSTREIDFKTAYTLGNNQEGKVVYSFEVFPNTEGLEIQLSTPYFYFINSTETNQVIQIKTKELKEAKTLKLSIQIFDIYNNLLKTESKFLKIVPNNSNYNYYESTNTHATPRFIGYSLSRAVSVVSGKEDYDIISVYTKTESFSTMAINCISNNSAIVIEQIYKDYNQTDLKISIDSKEELESGDYQINCKLSNSENTIDLPEIKLRYESAETKATALETTEAISKTSETKPITASATGFLGLTKTSSRFTYILISVFILLIVLILFSKNQA